MVLDGLGNPGNVKFVLLFVEFEEVVLVVVELVVFLTSGGLLYVAGAAT